MPTPTIRRLQLGHELRHLRERAGKDHFDAAPVIERSQSSISRIEGGLTGIRTKDLRDLVNFYIEAIGTDERGKPRDGGDPVNVDDFIELNKDAATRGRWGGYRNVYKRWFRMAVDLEADASTIDVYQTEIIFGLFQTTDYMRTLFTQAGLCTNGDQTTEAMIRARLERQEVLTRANPPTVTTVLSESTLRRVIGGREVMRNQLLHLCEVATMPNVHLHVASFECKAVAALSCPFSRYRIPSANQHTPPLDFVYVEQLTNGDYLDSPSDVNEYTNLWNGLLGAALDPVASRSLIFDLAKDLES